MIDTLNKKVEEKQRRLRDYQWFIDRIGQKVFRQNTPIHSFLPDGWHFKDDISYTPIHIMDTAHATNLFMTATELEMQYFDEIPAQYHCLQKGCIEKQAGNGYCEKHFSCLT